MGNDNSTVYGKLKRGVLAFGRRVRSLPNFVRLTALIGPVVLLTSAYYLSLWESVASFVVAIDHHSQLFQDFYGHYYPMGKTVLHSPTPVSGYFYSAFFALLLVPLGALQITPAMWSWGAIQAVGIVALYALPLIGLMRLKPLGIAFYTGVIATSFPLLHNTKWGQLSVLLIVCIIAAFHAHEKNQRILTGVLLAFAASVKYYPGLFLIYFILKRDLRVCIAFALAIIVLYVLFPAVVMGPDSWISFEIARAAALSDGGWTSTNVNSQYFVHVVARWNYFVSGTPLPIKPGVAQALTLVGYAIFLCNMAILWLMQRRTFRNQYVLSLVLIFLSLPFVIKTSWPHYFSYLPFCQIATLAHLISSHRALSSWREAILLLLPLLSIACSSVFVFDVFSHWSTYSAFGMVFLANLLLLAGFYFMTLKGMFCEQLDQGNAYDRGPHP